jgi:hypothetical protein
LLARGTGRPASLVGDGQRRGGTALRAREKNEEIEGERAVEEGLCFPLTGTEWTASVRGPRGRCGAPRGMSPGRVSVYVCVCACRRTCDTVAGQE